VDALERRFTELLAGESVATWPLTAQTYPRLWDAQMLSSLALAAAAVHKCANDIRLLCNLRELDEPFESEQIGSSAMPYKRNPMRCERATGLARFVMCMPQNALDTAATQWLERTLDDSSNRRLSIPEAFLALDGSLEVMADVCGGLVVHPLQCARRIEAELPFLATEEFILAAVARGGDRQHAHEAIRRHAQDTAANMKATGAANDLVARLGTDAVFRGIDLVALLRPERFVGRSAEQVDRFIAEVAAPIRSRYKSEIADKPALRV
jgi:adenylosuccinate lyase